MLSRNNLNLVIGWEDWQNWATEDDEGYAHAWAEWESDAFHGHATSAMGPVSTPQARKLLDFSVEVPSPAEPKVPDPMQQSVWRSSFVSRVSLRSQRFQRPRFL